MSLATNLLQKVHEAKQAEDEMSVPKYDDLKTPNNHVGNTSSATKEAPVSGLGDRTEKKPTADVGTPHNEKGRKMSEDMNPVINALGLRAEGGLLRFKHPNAPDQVFSIEYTKDVEQFLKRTLRRTTDVGQVFDLLHSWYEEGEGQDPRNQQGLLAGKGAWMESLNPIVQALNMHTENGMLRLTSPDGSSGMLVPTSGPIVEAINSFVTSPDARADTKAAAERLFLMLGQRVPGVKSVKPEVGIGEGQHKVADGEMKKPTVVNTAPATTASVRGKQDDEPTNTGNPGTGKEEKGVKKQQFTANPKDYKGGENEHKSMKKMHENVKGLEKLLGRKLNLQGTKTG